MTVRQKITVINQMTVRILNLFAGGLFFILIALSSSHAENWPTFQHDYQRSAKTKEPIPLPLYENWRFQTLYPPQPAWPAPARTDYWHRMQNLKARVTYDKAFHPILINDKIFFASSADDRIYCLDAVTGKELWSFSTEGPVRLAPTWHLGRLYVGSDDGSTYCLQAETGQLVWKWRRPEPLRLIPGNERLISNQPVRTSPIIENDHVFFLSGLFPDEGVEWHDLNAADGTVHNQRKNLDISPQGYLLLQKNKLYVPTGRTAPAILNKSNGKKLSSLQETGGTFALLPDDEPYYIAGKSAEVRAGKEHQYPIVTYSGEQVIIDGPISYLRSDSQITAVYRSKFRAISQNTQDLRKQRNQLAEQLWDLREQRKIKPGHDIAQMDRDIDQLIDQLADFDARLKGQSESSIKWQQSIKESKTMILAGTVLYVGGTNTITALSSSDGHVLWQDIIQGKGYGLAAANGRLVVSTDRGVLHCFTPQLRDPVRTIKQEPSFSALEAGAEKHPYETIAEKILQESGIHKGYCLVLGNWDAELAIALAKKSALTLIGIDDDPIRIANARARLHATGWYGSRISLVTGDLTHLPFSDYFANLIVSDRALREGNLPTSPDEVLRVLRPFGGKAFLGFPHPQSEWLTQAKAKGWPTVTTPSAWAIISRGPVPGGGEWTHLYADPANTSCSNDQLLGPMRIQWFGQPGPRDIINRHSRPMSPLFKHGRVFVPADNKIITMDAYNGTPLWEREVPDSRRIGALKDCGQMVVTDDALYIAAQDRCWQIDVVDGQVIAQHAAPQLIPGQRREWGYLAVVGDQLFGSGKKPGASFNEPARLNCDQLEGDFREMICSDYLFSVDRFSGEKKWTYHNGVVFNNTIAIGDGYLYLIESRNAQARADVDGRLRVDYFCQDENYLIKLNQVTGETIWQKAFSFPFSQIMYLSYAKGKLLVVGSYNVGAHVHYGLYAFNAEDGEMKWQASYQGDGIGGEHGEQWQHPVVIDNTVYQRPYCFDLETGKQGDYVLHRGGGGCGGLSGSAHYLYGRGSNPRMYALTETETSGTPLTRVNRPGCWINIIAAGGLILLPESSSGCTCAYPIQTSFAFVPGS